MKINNSLEWQSTREELMRQVKVLPYDRSIRQMLANIDVMIAELSKLEVEARRTKVSYYTGAQLTKVNESITQIEEILLIGMLML